MTHLRTAIAGLPVLAGAMLLHALAAHAGQRDLCVTCSDPEQTYVCRVDTPKGNPGDKALQLYCIVKTAKHGTHSACSVRRDQTGPCDGQILSHVYDGPMIPQALRSDIPAQPQMPGATNPALPDEPKQKGGEPETLIEMTGPAVNAGKAAVRTTGRAVKNAAGGTGETIGTIGKKAGRGVGSTAKSAGEAARDAGSAVGNAARYTYNCLKSLFRNCSNSSSE